MKSKWMKAAAAALVAVPMTISAWTGATALSAELYELDSVSSFPVTISSPEWAQTPGQYFGWASPWQNNIPSGVIVVTSERGWIAYDTTDIWFDEDGMMVGVVDVVAASDKQGTWVVVSLSNATVKGKGKSAFKGSMATGVGAYRGGFAGGFRGVVSGTKVSTQLVGRASEPDAYLLDLWDVPFDAMGRFAVKDIGTVGGDCVLYDVDHYTYTPDTRDWASTGKPGIFEGNVEDSWDNLGPCKLALNSKKNTFKFAGKTYRTKVRSTGSYTVVVKGADDYDPPAPISTDVETYGFSSASGSVSLK